MKLTHKQIAKMPRVNMSIDQFMQHIKRFPGPKPTKKKVGALENGEFLGVWKKPNGKFVRIHLKTIWIKPFNMLYSAKIGRYKGRELLISSMPLPKGPITPYDPVRR